MRAIEKLKELLSRRKATEADELRRLIRRAADGQDLADGDLELLANLATSLGVDAEAEAAAVAEAETIRPTAAREAELFTACRTTQLAKAPIVSERDDQIAAIQREFGGKIEAAEKAANTIRTQFEEARDAGEQLRRIEAASWFYGGVATKE